MQIIARVSVDNRTRALVKGLQRVTDVKLLTSRVEELSYHLLEFPETRGVAVKVSVYTCWIIWIIKWRSFLCLCITVTNIFSGERAAMPVAFAPGQRPSSSGCCEGSAGPGWLQRTSQRQRNTGSGHRRGRNEVKLFQRTNILKK